MITGTVLLLGALSLLVHNRSEDLSAGRASEQIMQQLREMQETAIAEREAEASDMEQREGEETAFSRTRSGKTKRLNTNEAASGSAGTSASRGTAAGASASGGSGADADGSAGAAGDGSSGAETSDGGRISNPYDPVMPVQMIGGSGYIGYLTVPDLNLELPVMAECDENRLRIAPCRYYGSVRTDNLVIAGHSYITHFRPLRQLSIGAQVLFTDMEYHRITYQVMDLEVLNPTEVLEMRESDYDLTLFTCTASMKQRFAVRCDRTEKNT